MPKDKAFPARPCRKCKRDFTPVRSNGALCDECRGAKGGAKGAGPSLAKLFGEAIDQRIEAALAARLGGGQVIELLRPAVKGMVEDLLRELVRAMAGA